MLLLGILPLTLREALKPHIKPLCAHRNCAKDVGDFNTRDARRTAAFRVRQRVQYCTTTRFDAVLQ